MNDQPLEFKDHSHRLFTAPLFGQREADDIIVPIIRELVAQIVPEMIGPLLAQEVEAAVQELAVLRSGDTMTGRLYLANPLPIADSEASSKLYVDMKASVPGPEGPTGPPGADGVAGADGAAGPPGAPGAPGPTGATGPQGIQGESGTGVSILGSLGSEGELPLSGSTGDAYLIGGSLYVWTGTGPAGPAGGWSNVGSIQGPQGAQGGTGPQGPVGPTGAASTVPGPQGPSGPQGNAGTAATITVGTTTTGTPGSNAAVSNSGSTSAAVFNFTVPQGPQGPQGLPGDPGGPPGPQGDTGATGPAGPAAGVGASATVLLGATNSSPTLQGAPPALSRIGNSVTMTYSGLRSTVSGNLASTVSYVAIPVGFQPTGNVSVAGTTPSGTWTIQQYTSGTQVFPTTPGSNTFTGWSLRFSANIGASAAISFTLSWQTADAMPAGYGVEEAPQDGTIYGRQNAAWTAVTGSGGGITSITAGTGLSGGTITDTGTIALANTAVTPGSYTNSTITVDAQGRLTNASTGSGGLPSGGGLYQGLLIGAGNTPGWGNIGVRVNSNIAFGTNVQAAAGSTSNYNFAAGSWCMNNITSGQGNTAIGYSCGGLTTGSNNIAIGSYSLTSTTTGNGNIALCDYALQLVAGNNNIGLGSGAGRYYTGSANLTTATNCIYVGGGSMASADAVTNEIVIGVNAIGRGSNTVMLGNTTTTSYLNMAVIRQASATASQTLTVQSVAGQTGNIAAIHNFNTGVGLFIAGTGSVTINNTATAPTQLPLTVTSSGDNQAIQINGTIGLNAAAIASLKTQLGIA